MSSIRRSTLLIGLALTLVIGNADAQPVAPPVGPPVSPPTLWNFLGIPQGLRKINGALVNRRGNFPGLEKKPPLKALADPANLFSDNPAIKRAAEIKKEEDLKKQKIKAIKYLAKIGCGCYNKDGSITEALVKAMDDCTEDVRLTTVEHIAEAAGSGACANCNERSCCNEEITKKLAELAYERDEFGCYKEPSERVREAAAAALEICCPCKLEDFEIEYEPEEVPPPETTEPGQPQPPRSEESGPPPGAEDADEAPEASEEDTEDGDAAEMVPGDEASAEPLRQPVEEPRAIVPREPARPVQLFSVLRQPPMMPRPAVQQAPATNNVAPVIRRPHALWPMLTESIRSQPAATLRQQWRPDLNNVPLQGRIVAADTQRGIAHVHTGQRNVTMTVGTTLAIYQQQGNRFRYMGEVQVYESHEGSANVRAIGSTNLAQVRHGDHVVVEPESRVASQPGSHVRRVGTGQR